MSGPSLRTTLQHTLDQLDAQIKAVEATHAALVRLRNDLNKQLNTPRAVRQCACGAGISRERELAGDTMCQRCEVANLVRRANAPRPQCEARQYGDQMSCGKCLLAWDTNDPDPPSCPVLSKVQSLKSKKE